jgi:hypothetical protein
MLRVPDSLEHANQNRGTRTGIRTARCWLRSTAVARAVWETPPRPLPSRPEVCRYVDDLVAIRYGSASGNNRFSLENAAFGGEKAFCGACPRIKKPLRASGRAPTKPFLLDEDI